MKIDYETMDLIDKISERMHIEGTSYPQRLLHILNVIYQHLDPLKEMVELLLTLLDTRDFSVIEDVSHLKRKVLLIYHRFF